MRVGVHHIGLEMVESKLWELWTRPGDRATDVNRDMRDTGSLSYQKPDGGQVVGVRTSFTDSAMSIERKHLRRGV